MENKEVAGKLREISSLLQEQGANPFRVSAYRRAAETIAGLKESVNGLIEREGLDGLIDLPNIGTGIARSINEAVKTGRMSRLEALKAGRDPIELFEQIPGVGPTLAHRIVEELHIHSLEALELAAHNGRLANVPGFSSKKIELARLWLANVLGYPRVQGKKAGAIEDPSVRLLLHIDQLYRRKAEDGELPKIAPKRFNPDGDAWLPVLHATRAGWHFTALYSNTARAHQLDKVKDWVVIFFYDKQHHEGQHTVVTETRGSLEGKRVVRGLEDECRQHYGG